MGKRSIFEAIKFAKNTSVFVKNHMEEFGDFYKLNLPTDTIYVVTDPKILHYILLQNEANYQKSKFYWGELETLMGKSIATLKGDDWVWMKRLQIHAYHKDRIHKYYETIDQITSNHFEKLKDVKEHVNLLDNLFQLTVSILLQVLFGISNESNPKKIANYIEDAEEIIAYRTKFPWRPYFTHFNGKNKKYKEILSFFDDLTAHTVKANKPSKNPKLIDLLIDESEFATNQGNVTLEDIRNEIMIHLGAGAEATAVSLTWTILLLNQNPNYITSIRSEIKEIFGDKNIDLDQISKLDITQKIIQESLRLYPVGHGLLRDAIHDDTINGQKIKSGDTFFISLFGIHRNPKFWKDPNSFIPERFENETDFKKYSYLPFGAGKHTCIGRHLASPMLIFILAKFVNQFDFSILNKDEIKPISTSALKPDRPLWTKLSTI